jgi:hypothetical protein
VKNGATISDLERFIAHSAGLTLLRAEHHVVLDEDRSIGISQGRYNVHERLARIRAARDQLRERSIVSGPDRRNFRLFESVALAVISQSRVVGVVEIIQPRSLSIDVSIAKKPNMPRRGRVVFQHHLHLDRPRSFVLRNGLRQSEDSVACRPHHLDRRRRRRGRWRLPIPAIAIPGKIEIVDTAVEIAKGLTFPHRTHIDVFDS